ncbi:MAG TPA: hypothetical protein VGD21_15835 [Lysobacter sp.]
MTRQIIVSGIALFLMACSPVSPQQSATTPSLQCGKDTDCKGDRICSSGQCVSPSSTPVVDTEQTSITKPVQPLQAESSAPSDPVPVCKPGDGRTKIPVWQPAVDAEGNLSSDPPQKDGQIVYIQLHQDAAETTCNDKELNSFSRPENPKEHMDGGLAVNIRGNAQFANGVCYFAGYYMNEDVMGMHQGWIETFYGAVNEKEILESGKYCLAKAIEQQPNNSSKP